VKQKSDSRAGGHASRLASTAVWSLPLLLPLVPAAISLLLAAPEGSDSDDVYWALIAIPLAALLGALARALQTEAIGESTSSAWMNALGAAAIGVVIGYLLWWQALEATCHGAYECPF
jgi:peptidoglycan/LPS O-acetylase OafA/YrhL